MAKEKREKPEHVVAYAIVPREGLYVARTMTLYDGKVSGFTDSDPDTRLACIGRVMRAIGRD
jgi:hypothetical protein